jgi:hypothetical protein
MGHHGPDRSGVFGQIRPQFGPRVRRGGHLGQRSHPERGCVADHGGCRERRRGLEGQPVFGVVGGWPELVAPFDGRPGPGGDLLEDVPVGTVAGVVDEAEQSV